MAGSKHATAHNGTYLQHIWQDRGHPKSRRNDGTADGTAISKYIGWHSRTRQDDGTADDKFAACAALCTDEISWHKSNLRITVVRKVSNTPNDIYRQIRANQCSAFNCVSVDSLLNSSTTVMMFRRVLSTYRLIIGRLWTVSPYIFANCCSIGCSVFPSWGKPQDRWDRKNDLYGRGHGRLDGESITAVSDNILKAYVSIVET